MEAGTLTTLDIELLALAARTATTCDELEAKIYTDGLVLESRGAKKANPACAALDRSRNLLFKVLDNLGLSPVGREKLHIQKAERRDNKFRYLEFIS
jgi:P27 family predicted phage terminase small subunit